MSFDPPTLPPAGWYPDPENLGGQRYWNGSNWDEAWQSGSGTGGYPDIGDWLGEAFRSMWRHVRAEGIVAVLTAAPASVMIAIALRVAVTDLRVVDNEIVGWDNDRIPTLVVLGIIAALLFLVGTLAATRLGLRIADRNDGTVPAPEVDNESEIQLALRSVGAALKTTPRAIGWTLLLVLGAGVVFAVVGVIAVAVPPLIILFLLAAIPLGIWIAVRLSFTYVAVVDRSGNPFKRSWEVTRHRFWSTFGRLLLLALITSAMSIAVNAITSQFTDDSSIGQDTVIEIDDEGNIERFDVDSLRPSTVGIIIGALGAVATGIFATGTSAIAYGRLYRDGGMSADP